MPVVMTDFVQVDAASTSEYAEVSQIADQLLEHLNEPGTQAQISVASSPGQLSSLVQATFLTQARALGFVDESKGLFAGYDNYAVRPDYSRVDLA